MCLISSLAIMADNNNYISVPHLAGLESGFMLLTYPRSGYAHMRLDMPA